MNAERLARILVSTLAASWSLSCFAAPAAPKCSLLTRDEVEQAIGPNDGGKSELTNQWALQGCRWTATGTKQGAPAGWHDAIEVAMFDELRTSWAREQATGEPVQGLNGAKYNASSGDLWFDCAGSRVCVIKVRTASSSGREDTAKRLAHAIAARVR